MGARFLTHMQATALGPPTHRHPNQKLLGFMYNLLYLQSGAFRLFVVGTCCFGSLREHIAFAFWLSQCQCVCETVAKGTAQKSSEQLRKLYQPSWMVSDLCNGNPGWVGLVHHLWNYAAREMRSSLLLNPKP